MLVLSPALRCAGSWRACVVPRLGPPDPSSSPPARRPTSRPRSPAAPSPRLAAGRTAACWPTSSSGSRRFTRRAGELAAALAERAALAGDGARRAGAAAALDASVPRSPGRARRAAARGEGRGRAPGRAAARGQPARRLCLALAARERGCDAGRARPGSREIEELRARGRRRAGGRRAARERTVTASSRAATASWSRWAAAERRWFTARA